jgi:RsiW-degrading membrane proteinase PrsW (M82 family)
MLGALAGLGFDSLEPFIYLFPLILLRNSILTLIRLMIAIVMLVQEQIEIDEIISGTIRCLI